MSPSSPESQIDPAWLRSVTRGRVILLTAMVIFLGAGVMSLIFDWGRGQGVAGVVRLLLELGLFYALWQGRGWALNAAAGLAALAALFGFVVFYQTWHPAMGVVGALFGGLALVLGLSPAVGAFLVNQRRAREPN